MSDENEVQPPQSYATRLGSGRAEAAQVAAEKAARQAEVAAAMDRRNQAAGTLAERLGASKQREQRIAKEHEEAKGAELARVSDKLGSLATSIQENLGMSYSERLSTLTFPENEISTKDLRTPTERKRDARAARTARCANDDLFADE